MRIERHSRPRPRRGAWRVAGRLGPPLTAFAVLLGAWEAFVRLRHIRQFLLPAPTAVAAELWDHPDAWWHDAVVTGREAVVGFVVALAVALLLAVLIVHIRSLERALLP